MGRMYVPVSALAVIAIGVFALAARAEPLNLLPGLWSVTYTYSMEGVGSGQPQADTSNSCVTADDLAKGNAFEDSEDEDCQRSGTQTATRWTGVEHCTSDEGTSERNVEINAVDPKTMNGSISGKGETGGTMKVTFTGKWIAAECGDED